VSRSRLPFVAAALGVSAALVSPITGATRGVRRSMGGRPDTPFDSPHFRDGVFVNTLPASIVESGSQGSMALEFATKGDRGRPAGAIPLVTPQLPAAASDLGATWLGHATVLLELGGHWVLTDPVWSERVSPSPTIGPKRNHPVPMNLADLPRLSAVLISHDHYDHLDMVTIDALVEQQAMPFVVPLGIGTYLRSWGVPEDRIIELDWDQSHAVKVAGKDDLVLTCTEARHFSGRGLFSRNNTLWSSWVVAVGAGRKRRSAFFGGDTGYTPAFAGIGERFGPFDLTVLPIGAYDARWSDIHMNPAEAVQTHRDVRGGILLPIHWATFDLAFHSWSAPVEWLREDAAEHDVTIAVPRPGERFDAETVPTADWWSAPARRRTSA
jgi:L-ascorbate metabolism protein UlaG (beta-lactamase superfamily)